MVARARRIITAYPRLSATVLLLVIALIPPVLWLLAQESLPPLAEIFPAGEIRIAVDASYPPFASVVDGELTGIDIDIGKELGRRIGLPVRFVNMGYDGLYDALTRGEVDLTLSALLVDQLRLAEVFYSHAYFDAGLVAVSPLQTPLENMTDLPGKSLAYEFGSTADGEARVWSRRLAAFDHRPYELPEHALDAVRLGEADAALVERISALLYLRQHPEWQTHLINVTHAPFAVAVRIDRKHLLRVTNYTLEELMDDGTLQAIIRRWL